MTNKHYVMRFIRHWHARLGVLAAIFLLVLAITGLALNHTDRLLLAKMEITSPLLMQWYGLKTELPSTGYQTKHGMVSHVEGLWVLNTQQLPITDGVINGAVDWQGMLVLASKHSLYLVNQDGQLVDSLTQTALPEGAIHRVGVDGDDLLIDTASGIYSTQDALGWTSVPVIHAQWAQVIELDQSHLQPLSQAFRPSLPLERILLDIHSGRILGGFGIWLMDIAAFILIMLSISGIWVYFKTMRIK